MAPRNCGHQHSDYPRSCELGNLYRFTEPIVLVSLARSNAYGYQIAQEAERLAVTHAGLDVAAIYRTLKRLEENGYAKSTWDKERPGPARREYVLTNEGWGHLQEWTEVLETYMTSVGAVREQCKQAIADHGKGQAVSPTPAIGPREGVST